MEKGKNYLTKEKKEALEKEVEDLKGPKRKEIIQALEHAKSLGDLSENAEYHHAREEQGKLEYRIKQIEEILSSSLIISGGGGEVVEVGSNVIAQKEGSTNEMTFQIVGSEEVDMAQGKISNHSLLGKALLGKKKGDTVSFAAPNGVVHYKIIKVF